MVANVKLSYFNLCGLGEGARWLLKYAGTEFEDFRFEIEQWPEFKPSMPFGQAPTYEEDGKVVNQSVAISRYLGKKANLAGDDAWEDLEIDAIVDTFIDLRMKLVKYSYEKDEDIKAAVKGEILDVALPFYLERFEQVAEKNNGHLALHKLTWADFYFVAALDYFNWMAEKDIIEDYPNLQIVKNNVVDIPVIKEWIEERPTTMF